MDRYKDEFSIEHKVKISLFKSKSNLNQIEKSNAEDWQRQQREKREEEEATEYFEEQKSRFEGMTRQASREYLENQNLGDQIRIRVQRKVSSLHQERQDREDAEKWFKENVEMKYYWNTKEKYNEILREKERGRGTLSSKEGVMKIVLEMFERKYGKPLQ